MTAVAVPLTVIGTVTVDAAAPLRLALTVTVCVLLLPSVVEAVVDVNKTVGVRATGKTCKATFMLPVSGI